MYIKNITVSRIGLVGPKNKKKKKKKEKEKEKGKKRRENIGQLIEM